MVLLTEVGGVEGLLAKLNTSFKEGLVEDANDFKSRVETFGTNFRESFVRTPFCTIFMGALEDFMLRILLVCAAISIIFDMSFASASERSTAWIEGVVIFLAVLVVSGVGSLNDY